VADAALAGLLLGAAIGLKPPNVLFGVGAALAYLLARRWREGAAFAVPVVAALLMLAFWKQRTLGELPILALEQARLAAGVTPLALELDVDRYVDLDLDHWRAQMDALREFFWSARVAQWAPIAGLVAVLRAGRYPVAGLLGGWLAAFLLVKGMSPRGSIEDGSFWRLLMPAWPAFLLLFASIPLLVPTLLRRLGSRRDPPADRPVRMRWVALVAVLTLVAPAAATAASSLVDPPTPAVVPYFPSGEILTPVDTDIEVTSEPVEDGLRLSWTGGQWRADVFYRVFRATLPDGGLQCSTSNDYAWVCYFIGELLATTRERSFVVEEPQSGDTYRIGIGTNWANDPELGDVFVFSPPVDGAR
jgi:hypothetical protein